MGSTDSTDSTGSTGALDGSGGSSGSTTDGSGSGSTDHGSTTVDHGATDDGGLVCTSVYDPVCGKDGETYDHPCSAIAAGVEIRHDGPCFGDCEGSCVVAPQGPSLLALALVVLAFVRPRRRSGGP